MHHDLGLLLYTLSLPKTVGNGELYICSIVFPGHVTLENITNSTLSIVKINFTIVTKVKMLQNFINGTELEERRSKEMGAEESAYHLNFSHISHPSSLIMTRLSD